MIDPELQEQAALYALSLLQGEELRAFELALARDSELEALVDDLAQSAAALVRALPATPAPPALRERVLAKARGESPAPARRSWSAVLGWAATAVFACTTGALFVKLGDTRDRSAERVRIALFEQDEERAKLTEAIQAEALGRIRVEAQLAAVQQEQQRLAAERERLIEENGGLEKQLDGLRTRNALAQVQIATLKSQVSAFEKVTGVAVWDAERQTGVVRLENLPALGTNEDYQLWVIDPKVPSGPVSAGVVAVGAGGVTRLGFRPARPIARAEKFALSIERRGGSTTPRGDIVLLSN